MVREDFSLHFVTVLLRSRVFVTPALFSLHAVAACAPWLFKTPRIASNLQGIAEERPSPCCNENPDPSRSCTNVEKYPKSDDAGQCFAAISLQQVGGCPSAMLWALLASPGVFKSHGAHALAACNENSGGVTKMLFRSKNVTKCNEISKSLAREHFSLHFVTVLLRASIFVTPALFSLHAVAACAPWLFKTPRIASNLQGIAEERPSPCCNENPDPSRSCTNVEKYPKSDDAGQCFAAISLQQVGGCPSAMLWALLASPGVFKSHGAHALAGCNENSGGVTKMLFRNKNVTKCNEI